MRNKDLQNETNTQRVYFHPLSMSGGNLGPAGIKQVWNHLATFSKDFLDSNSIPSYQFGKRGPKNLILNWND